MWAKEFEWNRGDRWVRNAIEECVDVSGSILCEGAGGA